MPQAHVRLDSNPISPLLVTLKGLLEGRKAPIYIQHIGAILSSQDSWQLEMHGQTTWQHIQKLAPYKRPQLFMTLYMSIGGDYIIDFLRSSSRTSKKIVHSCKACQPFLKVPPLQSVGVNPRGLKPNVLWQTDVTHFAAFGRLKYVFVSIDTFSGACWAMAHTGEKN